MTEGQAPEEVVEEISPWYVSRHFWFGFIGWFVSNCILYSIYQFVLIPLDARIYPSGFFNRAVGWITQATPFLILVLNIGVLIFLAIKRPRMAGGILGGMAAAFGCTFALVLAVGVIFTVGCFIILASSPYFNF